MSFFNQNWRKPQFIIVIANISVTFFCFLWTFPVFSIWTAPVLVIMPQITWALRQCSTAMLTQNILLSLIQMLAQLMLQISALERGRKVEELQKRLVESEMLRTRYNRKVTVLKDQVSWQKLMHCYTYSSNKQLSSYSPSEWCQVFNK